MSKHAPKESEEKTPLAWFEVLDENHRVRGSGCCSCTGVQEHVLRPIPTCTRAAHRILRRQHARSRPVALLHAHQHSAVCSVLLRTIVRPFPRNFDAVSGRLRTHPPYPPSNCIFMNAHSFDYRRGGVIQPAPYRTNILGWLWMGAPPKDVCYVWQQVFNRCGGCR